MYNVSNGQYNGTEFSFNKALTSFVRRDSLFDSPYFYYAIFALMFAGIVTASVSFGKSYCAPLTGTVVACRAGNKNLPFATIPLQNHHIKKNVFYENELVRISPLLNGIKKLKVTSSYVKEEVEGVVIALNYVGETSTKPVIRTAIGGPEEAVEAEETAIKC